MPQPTSSQVHTDAVLSNISTAYIQSQDRFIASKVFPVIPVDKQSDLYYTYTKNDWFRDEAQRRVSGTESAGSGYGLSTASYACDKFAFHKDIDDDTRNNADTPLNPDREATNFVTQRLLLRQEIQWASDFFAASVWTPTDQTGVSAAPGANQFLQWNDAASNPLNDIEVGKEAIISTTGFEANTLVIGYQVFRQLKLHPDIIDRVKYTTAQNITTEMLARMFELDNIFVCKAVKATNNEGATGAYGFVHGKSALLLHVAPTPGLMTPSAGYTFAWKGVSGGLGTTIGVKRFRMEHLETERVEGTIAFDNKVVGADLGQFYATAVA